MASRFEVFEVEAEEIGEVMPAGQPKKIESPEQLLQYFEQYTLWAKAHPYRVHDYVGKDAKEVRIEKERATTWIGFEAWLSVEGIAAHLGHYEQNTDDHYTEYLPVIRAIKRRISQDIVEGALAGVYNQNIAARIEGLTDKREIDMNAKVDFKEAE